MTNNADQRFLSALMLRVHRYQPMLEQEFRVRLGPVGARELRVGRFIDETLDRYVADRRRRIERRKGRPPGTLAESAMRMECRLTKAATYWPIWLRFRLPDFCMRWNQRQKVIDVSFLGWRSEDFEKNVPKLDQYVVHELAHGVWDCLNPEDSQRGRREWRLWNEGFSHYIADIDFRSRYPSDAVVFDDWSPFRLRAREHVARLVAQEGRAVLKRLPQQWVELTVVWTADGKPGP